MSTLNEEEVFAAVGRLFSRDGTATLQKVVAETGVSIGSLYHHYGSREGLLARTWLDAVQSFHADFMEAVSQRHKKAGEDVALVTSRFCRKQREKAIVLMCCRRSEFLSDATPEELQEKIRNVNIKASAALKQFADDHGYSLETCRLAIVAFPLGAVRSYLPDQDVPESVDEYILGAYRSALRIDRGR